MHLLRCRLHTISHRKDPKRTAKHSCEDVRPSRDQCSGITHEPITLPSDENELMKASATARLEGGRGMELLTQAQKTMKPA